MQLAKAQPAEGVEPEGIFDTRFMKEDWVNLTLFSADGMDPSEQPITSFVGQIVSGAFSGIV